jgi:hypothetical protein
MIRERKMNKRYNLLIAVLTFLTIAIFGLTIYISIRTRSINRNISNLSVQIAKSEIITERASAPEYGRRCVDVPPSLTGRVSNKARIDFYEEYLYKNRLTFKNEFGDLISSQEALKLDFFTVCWWDFEPREDPVADILDQWFTNGEIDRWRAENLSNP